MTITCTHHLSTAEHDLIRRCYLDGEIREITRNSPRPFDIHLSGNQLCGQHVIGFSAWLPLAAINRMTNWWRDPDIADLSDYPEMVRQGDWSGIRDSDETRIWSIFCLHVLAQS